MTNILILSAGTRNKIVQYFQNALGNDGKVIATDMSPYSPALYVADKYYVVPPINSDKYIDTILEICKKEKVNGVLSLIDPELSILAKEHERFSAIGVMVIGSPFEACQLALNKMEMYKWLIKHGFNCAKSYENISEFNRDYRRGLIDFPVIIKPKKGSASVGIQTIEDMDTLDFALRKSNDILIQEILVGEEIGVDCYVDIISEETVSIFAKKKMQMRAGETYKSVSFLDKKLFELIEQFNSKCGWKGPIDIDLFEVKGEYYVSEVNPRFGGGYPHAHECGCNHIRLIDNNVNGVVNKPDIGNYEKNVYMMKYNEIMIRKY